MSSDRVQLPSSLGAANALAQHAALSARSAPTTREPGEAGKQFEQLLAGMLVRELRRALPNGFFGQEMGADTYESWLDEHLGRALSESGALGIAGMVKAGLERQGGASETTASEPEPAVERASRAEPIAAREAATAAATRGMQKENP